MEQYSTRGRHITADFWGVKAEILNDQQRLVEWMQDSIEKAGATILDGCWHRFDPQGVTALLLLSESHMSIHTYPERGFAALDVYTCGEHVNPWVAIWAMSDLMKPACQEFKQLDRGIEIRG